MAFNYSPRIIQDGLVLYLDAANTKSYPTTGTTWSDLSRRGNNGTLTNGPTFNSTNGGSIVFDGVDDWVDSGTSLSLNNESTFSITFNSNVTNTVKYLFSKAPDTGFARDFSLLIVNNNINFWFGTSSLNYVTLNTPDNSIGSNKWYNVTATRDGSFSKIYINGNEEASTSYSFVQTNLGHRLNIGNLGNTNFASRFFNGKVTQAKIYNRALTATEVLQNYNATKSRFGL